MKSDIVIPSEAAQVCRTSISAGVASKLTSVLLIFSPSTSIQRDARKGLVDVHLLRTGHAQFVPAYSLPISKNAAESAIGHKDFCQESQTFSACLVGSRRPSNRHGG
jgi:hypothetical protein